jgi:hypothetical protein
MRANQLRQSPLCLCSPRPHALVSAGKPAKAAHSTAGVANPADRLSMPTGVAGSRRSSRQARPADEGRHDAPRACRGHRGSRPRARGPRDRPRPRPRLPDFLAGCAAGGHRRPLSEPGGPRASPPDKRDQRAVAVLAARRYGPLAALLGARPRAPGVDGRAAGGRARGPVPSSAMPCCAIPAIRRTWRQTTRASDERPVGRTVRRPGRASRDRSHLHLALDARPLHPSRRCGRL